MSFDILTFNDLESLKEALHSSASPSPLSFTLELIQSNEMPQPFKIGWTYVLLVNSLVCPTAKGEAKEETEMTDVLQYLSSLDERAPHATVSEMLAFVSGKGTLSATSSFLKRSAKGLLPYQMDHDPDRRKKMAIATLKEALRDQQFEIALGIFKEYPDLLKDKEFSA